MKIAPKSLLLALSHVVLLSTVGGKMLFDRATLPHAWVKTVPFDPSLPIRGRYLRLTLAVDNPSHWTGTSVDFHVQDGKVTMGPAEFNNNNYVTLGAGGSALISPPVAFFISDQASDPSRHLLPGQELWVEVTFPPHGHPRPIRLGVKHDGVLTPLN